MPRDEGCVQTLLPFDEDQISGDVFKAPATRVPKQLPRIELVGRTDVTQGVQQLTLQPSLPGRGYFGSINITASIIEWSLPPTASASHYTVGISPLQSL